MQEKTEGRKHIQDDANLESFLFFRDAANARAPGSASMTTTMTTLVLLLLSQGAQAALHQRMPQRSRPGAEVSMQDASQPAVTARAASAALLRIGTVPFCLLPLLPLVSDDLRPICEPLLICHASVIIAFIGGLQQAAAIQHDLPPWIAVLAIGIALFGTTTTSAIATGLISTHLAFITLTVAYLLQLLIERTIPPTAKQSMLAAERQLPMIVASFSLAVGAALT